MSSKNKNMTAKQVYAYLASKGIPKPMMHTIRDILADEAVREADNIRYNRIYTAIAIMLHRHLGFGRKRTLDALHYFDDLCGEMLNTDKNWGDLMKELDEELHIVIRCGDPDENPLHEYESEFEKEDGA
jgi:3-deoxy-D-arabino-heptulosonate 7-phosphate (DAHP) synthase class II